MDTPIVAIPSPANLEATAILDFGNELMKEVVRSVGPRKETDRSWLQEAHTCLMGVLSPVYSVNERQPTSETIRKRRGSCSQRMACLEAVGRAVGIPSRVRALRVKGTFWYPRFRFLRIFIPQSVLLLWPQFFLDGNWVDFDELYEPLDGLVGTAHQGFANDAESLFEAVRDTPVDFLGKTRGTACANQDCDLSRFILANEGFFDTRDDALKQMGSFQDTFRGRLFEMLLGDTKTC
jgi:transglutaminase superfamily protein